MRLLTSLLFVAAAAAGAAGCVGDVGAEDPGTTDDNNNNNNNNNNTDPRPAKDIFKADVYPAVGKCSGGACHDIAGASGAVSKFYGATADTTYDAAVKQPSLVGTFTSISPILAKIQVGHKGLSYTSDETTKITNWLAKETAERSAGGGSNQPPPYDPKAALKEWSGCLSLANFQAANMTTAWSTLAADNLQKCINCHQGAVGGFLILNNTQNYFDAITKTTGTMLMYFTVDTVAQKVIVNTGALKSANLIQGHPTFNATTNAGLTALQKLYDSTLARKTANQCDPPRLTD
jgi:hypothetical protein